MTTFANREALSSVRAKINSAIERIDAYGGPPILSYATLAQFQAAVTAGLTMADGLPVVAAGEVYIAETGAALAGIPAGWRPVDWVYSRAELEAATWEVAPGRNVILVLESGFVVPYVRTPFATDLIAGDLSTWKVAGFTIADAVAIGNEIASANAALAASLRNISDGSAAAPGFKFSLDLDTGFYRPGDNQIGIATNGVSRAVLSDTALNVSVPITGAGVVGIVSQSGGLSTGAIIESGSNANGTYTKFADGTMICTKTVTGLGPISTASGSLFIQSPGVALGTLPQTFIAAPVRRVDCYSPTGLAAWVQSATAPTTTTGGTVQLVRATTTANTDFVITATFIGKWF